MCVYIEIVRNEGTPICIWGESVLIVKLIGVYFCDVIEEIIVIGVLGENHIICKSDVRGVLLGS